MTYKIRLNSQNVKYAVENMSAQNLIHLFCWREENLFEFFQKITLTPEIIKALQEQIVKNVARDIIVFYYVSEKLNQTFLNSRTNYPKFTWFYFSNKQNEELDLENAVEIEIQNIKKNP